MEDGGGGGGGTGETDSDCFMNYWHVCVAGI